MQAITAGFETKQNLLLSFKKANWIFVSEGNKKQFLKHVYVPIWFNYALSNPVLQSPAREIMFRCHYNTLKIL